MLLISTGFILFEQQISEYPLDPCHLCAIILCFGTIENV